MERTKTQSRPKDPVSTWRVLALSTIIGLAGVSAMLAVEMMLFPGIA